MNPTNATTMIRGPGVVSASAKPSIIWSLVSQCNFDTVTWATYGMTVYEPPKVTNAVLVKNSTRLFQKWKSSAKK
jgi:hypothetical protein